MSLNSKISSLHARCTQLEHSGNDNSDDFDLTHGWTSLRLDFRSNSAIAAALETLLESLDEASSDTQQEEKMVTHLSPDNRMYTADHPEQCVKYYALPRNKMAQLSLDSRMNTSSHAQQHDKYSELPRNKKTMDRTS